MNKPFCQTPWSHVFINNDGKVYPCVFSVEEKCIGNINNNSLDEIWRKNFSALRNQFTNGHQLASCNFCLQNEANQNKSMRTLVNNQPRSSDWENGPKFIGIKFSNVCNLTCRICNSNFSSAWAKELGTSKNSVVELNSDFIEKLIPGLNNASFFHFTGGEPLLSSGHNHILSWLKKNKSDSTLTYNTNLTKLEFGKTKFVDEWKTFKKVYINFSIDAWGDRAEYLRTGTSWKNILNNIHKLKSNSNIEIIYYITLYTQNIIHLPDLINNIIIHFNANSSSFFLNYLNKPHQYHISSTPIRYRAPIINDIKTLQKKLFVKDGYAALSLITQLSSIINVLEKDYVEGKWEETISQILKSQPAGLSFYDYFPEFTQ